MGVEEQSAVFETRRNFRFLALVSREKVSYHWHKASGMKLDLGAWHLSVPLDTGDIVSRTNTLTFSWSDESNVREICLISREVSCHQCQSAEFGMGSNIEIGK